MAIPALLIVLLSALPAVYMVYRLADVPLETILHIYQAPRTLELLTNSVLLAATVTFGTICIGVFLAWVFTRTQIPCAWLLQTMAAIPLAIPSYVAAYAWVSTTFVVREFWGSVLVLTLCTYPYVYLPVLAAFHSLNPAQEEVAQTLGASRFTIWRTIILPAIGPAIGSGALLVATYTLSDFGAVSLLRMEVFTQAIYMAFSASFDRTPALVFSTVLLAITIVLTVSEMRVQRGSAVQSHSGTNRLNKRINLKGWTWPVVGVICTIYGLALVYPIGAIISWIVVGSSEFESLGRMETIVVNTFSVSAIAAVCTIILALPVGITIARVRSWIGTTLQSAIYIAHGLPSLVVALSMVFFGIRFLYGLYHSLYMVIVAYVLIFMPLAVASVRGSVALSSEKIEEVAATLGTSNAGILAKITVPLAIPGVLSGAALVMLAVMKELPATLMLRPAEFDTFASRLWLHTDDLAYAAAAPYALGIVCMAAIPSYLISRYMNPAEGPGREDVWS